MSTTSSKIKFLKFPDINIIAWDACIAQSPQRIVYAASWYLNIVSPGWSAIVMETDGKYAAAFPLPAKKKWGLDYLVQPFATQQLGFFYGELAEDFVGYVLKYIKKKYWFLDFNLNTKNFSIQLPLYFKTQERLTYCLLLSSSYKQILLGFSENHRRNIKKAGKSGLKVEAFSDHMLLIELFRSTKGKELPDIGGKEYEMLFMIFEKAIAVNAGECYQVRDPDGKLMAAAFFLNFSGRLIYLMGATAEEGRTMGAMHLLIDWVIQKYADNNFLLDFEGGQMDGIGRFYQGFGAEEYFYKKIRYSKIPFLMKT